MCRFRELAREIHRRSVWQVLGVYLVSVWGALEVVDVLTEHYGLPEWVPPFALVLLIVGLPIVLATAIVQEGGPGAERRDEDRMPRADEELVMAGEPNPRVPEGPDAAAEGEVRSGGAGRAAPGVLHRLLTWRNAILGGVGAFTVLGLAVGGYFVMWSTGIGPVGSLVAQGVIDEREPVVLADFVDDTPDRTMGGVVTEALRVDLVESPVLTVLDRSFVEQVLRRMDRDPSTRLVPEVAREVAIREGIKAVIEGEVSPAGDAYLLTARIVEAGSGRTLAAFRETVEDESGLIEGIDRLSRRIREKAGESLRSIRAGEPLTAVTTSSLEALRRYSEANRAIDRGDHPRALELLDEAVARDTAFAMAWRKIGVVLGNLDVAPAREREALVRAYRHGDRLTERERYHARAMYHREVTGDGDEAIRAYRALLEREPHDPIALNNLALTLMERRAFREAESLLRRAVSGPAESVTAHYNLVNTLVALGRPDEAARAQRRFAERYPEHPSPALAAADIAFWTGRYAAADSVLRAAASGASPRLRFLLARGRTFADVVRGRADRARERLREILEVADIEGWERDVIRVNRDLAELELVLLADTAAALRRMDGALAGRPLSELPVAARPYRKLAAFYGRAGRPDRARALVEKREAELTREMRPADYRIQRRVDLARIALAEGRHDEAAGELAAAHRLSPCETCTDPDLARALELAGEPDSAIAVYERYRSNLAPEPRIRDYAYRLPAVLERLAALQEEAGRPDQARRHYRELAELWADADPVPRERALRARERIAALGGGPW